MEIDKVYQMDALDLLYSLEKHSVNAVISDFPYGTTAASWDVMPDLPKLWDAIKHALKPQGVVVTTASQPFTSMLVMSNLKWFKYCLIWYKEFAGNFSLASSQPMRVHEDILVFCDGSTPYAPQMIKRAHIIHAGGMKPIATLGVDYKALRKTYSEKFPISILYFPRSLGRTVHPTQKPVALYEYLILTYTQSGALVVDPYCGSGTTCLAARNTGRHFIGGDLSPDYVAIAQRRLAQDYTRPMFTD